MPFSKNRNVTPPDHFRAGGKLSNIVYSNPKHTKFGVFCFILGVEVGQLVLSLFLNNEFNFI